MLKIGFISIKPHRGIQNTHRDDTRGLFGMAVQSPTNFNQPFGMPSAPTPGFNPTAAMPAMSQSVPLSAPFPDIPPPHMVAPYLYFNPPRPKPPLVQQLPPAAPAIPRQAPVQQQPPPAKPPQPPPAPPPQTPPPQPKAPEKPSPAADTGALDEATTQSLNKRLNDQDANVRADAALELFRTLDSNPSLAEDPKHKQTIEAFTQKIMKDTSPLVRGAGELLFQTGTISTPSKETENILQQLSKKSGLTNESKVASQILGGISSNSLKQNKLPKKDAPAKSGEDPSALAAAKQAPTPGAAGAANPSASSQTPASPSAASGTDSASSQTPASPSAAGGADSASSQTPASPTSAAASAGGTPTFSGSAAASGTRLNVVSSQQHATPPGGSGTQKAGQRLDYQEGVRS
jgi:hypothetical protein